MNERPQNIHGARMQTARLLREARTALRQPHGAGEAVEWAHLSLPEQRLAHRLHVMHLQRTGDHHAADSMTLHGLRRWPEDRWLRLARVAGLIDGRRFAEAAVELAGVLRRRPDCARALHLQARLEWKQGHPASAASLLERAIEHGAGCRSRAALIDLVRLGIEAGAPAAAEAAMRRLHEPPAELAACLHESQGRWSEMDEALALAAAQAADAREADLLTARRIAMLDRLGNVLPLRALLADVDASRPRSLLAAANASLRLGEFARAIRAGFALRNHCDVQQEALILLTVAGALAMRRELSRRAMERLRRSPGGLKAASAVMARCWQRGLMGRVIHGQRFNHRAGRDPGTSLLRPLLAQAGKAASLR